MYCFYMSILTKRRTIWLISSHKAVSMLAHYQFSIISFLWTFKVDDYIFVDFYQTSFQWIRVWLSFGLGKIYWKVMCQMLVNYIICKCYLISKLILTNCFLKYYCKGIMWLLFEGFIYFIFYTVYLFFICICLFFFFYFIYLISYISSI